MNRSAVRALYLTAGMVFVMAVWLLGVEVWRGFWLP
jgi:hypothetical protein